MPNNYYQAFKRVEGLKARFQKNPEFFKKYKEFMEQTLQAGYAHKISESELEGQFGRVWYLTHHGVFHKVKRKIRVVFDCALKYKDVSLNDKLLQGPNLANSLIGVLLRFREGKVAFMADIAKMFYQVKVPQKDQDFLRFLWFPDGDLDQKPAPYRLSVHVFGAVSSPSCANFALQKVAKDIEGISKEAQDVICQDFYVDDLLKSVDSDNQAVQIINEVSNALSQCGFHLTGFISNSRSVLAELPNEELSKGLKTIDLSKEELPQERALGVIWDVEEDNLCFKIKEPSSQNTRRGLLSIIFSLYDPLGIVAPTIVSAKRIFKRLASEI